MRGCGAVPRYLGFGLTWKSNEVASRDDMSATRRARTPTLCGGRHACRTSGITKSISVHGSADLKLYRARTACFHTSVEWTDVPGASSTMGSTARQRSGFGSERQPSCKGQQSPSAYRLALARRPVGRCPAKERSSHACTVIRLEPMSFYPALPPPAGGSQMCPPGV